LQPAAISQEPPSGKVSLLAAKQKLWRVANFRLEIDGLDCTHVSRIEAFTVRREVTFADDGDGQTEVIPGNVAFPNLKVTLSAAFADTWYDWHEQFVVHGHSGEAFERSGTLSFLSVDLQSELTKIELHHLGIARLSSAEDQPASQTARLTAEVYCEQMVLVDPQAGGGP
jgi:hypothetical protein